MTTFEGRVRGGRMLVSPAALVTAVGVAPAALVAGFLALVVVAGDATAQTWDGGGADESWGTANNWNPNGTPAFTSSTDIVFYSAATKLNNFIGSARTIRSLTFNADADSSVTIRLQSILSNTGGASRSLTLESDTGTSTIAVAAGASGLVSITSGYGGQLRIKNNLVIDHEGSNRLAIRNFNDTDVAAAPFPTITKNGSGAVYFGGNISQRGAFVINGGTVGFGGTGTVNPASNLFRGSVTINGGTLDLATFAQTVENSGVVTLQSGVITGTTGSLASAVDFQMHSGTASGILAGGGGLTKTTGGTVTLSGANTYSGPTTVSAGTLALGAAAAIGGSSGLSIASGAFLDLSALVGGLTLGSGQSLGGQGSVLGNLVFGSGSRLGFSTSDTLAMAGGTASFFAGDPGSRFGIDDLVGISSSTPAGTYTLISGTVDTANLDNLGSANAYDLGDGVSAYFQQGSLAVTVVPEPGMLGLASLGLAAAGLGMRRRFFGC